MQSYHRGHAVSNIYDLGSQQGFGKVGHLQPIYKYILNSAGLGFGTQSRRFTVHRQSVKIRAKNLAERLIARVREVGVCYQAFLGFRI